MYKDELKHDSLSVFIKLLGVDRAYPASSHIVSSLVLSGGMLDNLKKAYELKKLKGNESKDNNTLAKVQNMDLLGDFLKDVLYPAALVSSIPALHFCSALCSNLLFVTVKVIQGLFSSSGNLLQ